MRPVIKRVRPLVEVPLVTCLRVSDVYVGLHGGVFSRGERRGENIGVYRGSCVDALPLTIRGGKPGTWRRDGHEKGVSLAVDHAVAGDLSRIADGYPLLEKLPGRLRLQELMQALRLPVVS